MFTEEDIKRFIRRTIFWFTALFTVLAALQIAICFWENWNVCTYHYSDKNLAANSECPTLKSEYLRRACHEARHDLSLSPFLCAVQDTIDDVRRIMWMDEVKTLMGNLWFGVLLAFGVGLLVLYCAMSRVFGGGGGYPSPVSVVYPTEAWMRAFRDKSGRAEAHRASFDIPGVTIPAVQTPG